jgi:hypothetical protein
MKVFVLAYLYKNWEFQGRIDCMCKNVWEIELYETREAAEAAAKGRMFPKISEREISK